MSFANWLNEEYLKYQLRAGRKLSLSSFAGYLNVNPSTLSSWLCGDRSPNKDNLYKLAEKLGQQVFTIAQAQVAPDQYGRNSIRAELYIPSLPFFVRENNYLIPRIR